MELKQSGSFIARTLSYEVCPVKTKPIMLACITAMPHVLVQYSD